MIILLAFLVVLSILVFAYHVSKAPNYEEDDFDI
jgi:hypothetical protein